MNMLEALLAEGLVVKPEPGWETRSNGDKSRFKPVGVLLHWDAIASHPKSNDVYVWNNRYGGTLYHQVIEPGGVVRLLADDGYVWNAGTGDLDLVSHITQGKPGIFRPNDTSEDRKNGNPYFYGITIQYHPDYDGAVPAVQAEALYKAAAAICRREGWDERVVYHHRSFTTRKPDIRTLDVAEGQAAVRAILLGGTPVEPPQPPPSVGDGTYVVQKGDTLGKIAAKFDVTVAELVALNNISDPNLIRVGQVLQIPGLVTYEVQRGDTLGAIARKFEVTVAEIVEANGITDPNLIRVGQVLIIPGAIAPAPEPVPFPGRLIKLESPYMRGDDVGQVQTWLNDRIRAGLKVDGVYGPVTRGKVVEFQTARKLSADGVVGPVTWLELQS